MTAGVLNGRVAAENILNKLRHRIQRQSGTVTLATIQVGRRPDSTLYLKLKSRAANRVGIKSEHFALPATVSQAKLIQLIVKLNQRRNIHGILIQLPLPPHLKTDMVVSAISIKKDVDGFHPRSLVVPPTIAAVLYLVQAAKPRARATAVILGKKSVFTRRLARELSRCGHFAVIVPVTNHIPRITKPADIIVTAIGRGPRLTARFIKPGAIVIDVGIRRHHGDTSGDVDKSVWTKAKAVSPVPGGVGPLTVAYLLVNTFKLAGK